MTRPAPTFPFATPVVVGSFGDAASLAEASPATLSGQCDIAEVRLDLLHAEARDDGSSLWRHLLPFQLLFTARCHAEGSPFDLDAETRIGLLRAAAADACLIDIEAASVTEMSPLIGELREAGIPWIASFHDFGKLPSRQTMLGRAAIAKGAGASGFKVAARLHAIDDLAALVRFQKEGCGLPLSTMGMGALAPVSRLACAQAGSLLNYGFIGGTATAPGQWSAARLREGIRSLEPLR